MKSCEMTQKIPPSEKILVPAAEAAALLSMGKSTFWRELKNGNIPKAVEIGGLKRWRVSDLLHAAQPARPPTSA
jgi:predicted DNA-binding transcriptional regulator AlpA